MSDIKIKVTVFRFDPSVDEQANFKHYNVPLEKGMSAMNALDYIYQNIDSSLSYYDHAGCDLGICARCSGKINGKSGLFCQTLIDGDVKLEPRSKDKVLKDLITKRAEKSL